MEISLLREAVKSMKHCCIQTNNVSLLQSCKTRKLVYEILATVGITLGHVLEYDVPGEIFVPNNEASFKFSHNFGIFQEAHVEYKLGDI